jgi:sigma-B regulation protein RsbU (phosphoserine phosphatase)
MEIHYQHAPCLLFSTTDDGALTAVNETLCRHLHYTRHELIGQRVDVIFTMATRIFQQTHFLPLLRMQGVAEEIYLTLQSKEGSPVPVLVSASRTVNGDEALTTFAGIVVYHRKKFEDELVAAKKAAEKALDENLSLLQMQRELQERTEMLDQQMYLVRKQNEELRQFNHVVTHELQEPLRKLFLFTSMLSDADQAANNARPVSKIRSVAEQLRSLLSGLQQYVWLTESTVTGSHLDLGRLVAGSVEVLRQDHPGLSISVQMTGQPVLFGDKEQMQFLVQEICTNAVRFRKADSPVELSISASVLQQNKFRSVSGKYAYTTFLKIRFADSGLGFDPVYKEQAFSLFKRLHATSGRGIGLSLCRKIVENHQGTITLDSRVGAGTTVTILLPLPGVDDESGTGIKEHQTIFSGNDN